MFNGMCIGGPKDGEHYSCEYNQFNWVESKMPPIQYNAPTSMPITQVAYKKYHYIYDEIRINGHYIGVWLVGGGGGGGMEAALHALMAAYESKAKARKKRRERYRKYGE